jgi:hypothetical protein
MTATPEQIQAFQELRNRGYFNEKQTAIIEELERRGELDANIVPLMQKVKGSAQPAPAQPALAQPAPAQPAQEEPEQENGFLNTVMNITKGVPALEAMANFISSSYGVPVAGVTGLIGGLVAKDLETAGMGNVLGDPLDFADKVIEEVEDKLVYKPQTEGGQQLLEAAQYPFKKLSDVGQFAGDKVAEQYGPEAGATVKSLIESLPLAIAPAAKGVKTSKSFINRKKIAELTERARPFLEEKKAIYKGELTQKLKDQRMQKELAEASSASGESYRQGVAARAEELKSDLAEASGRSGETASYVIDEAGKFIKESLIDEKKRRGEKKDTLYLDSSEAASELGNVFVEKNNMVAAAPKMPDMIDIYDANTKPRHNVALQKLFYKYGLDELVPKRSLEIFEKSGKIDRTPLSIANFERFRQGLNRISRENKGSSLYEIINPVREALDFELGEMAKAKGTQNLPPEVYKPLKEARSIVESMKTDFSPNQLTGKLVAHNKDGFTPVVEASKVYDMMIAKSMPKEQIQSTLYNLSKSGADGKKAIATLQAAVVLDLVESSFGKNGVFDTAAFKRRINSIKQDKLEIIFKNNPSVVKKLKNYDKIADAISNNVRTKPGWFQNFITSFGLINIMGRVPGLSAVLGVSRLGKDWGTAATNYVRVINPKIPGQPRGLGKFAAKYPKIANAVRKGTKGAVFSGMASYQAEEE